MKTNPLLPALLLLVLAVGLCQAAQRRCSSATCTGQCREACNYATLERTWIISATFKEGQDVDALAASMFAPDAFMSVSPIASFEGGKLALEYLVYFSRPVAPVLPLVKLLDLKVNHMQLSQSASTTVFDLVLASHTNPSDPRSLRGIAMATYNNQSKITHMTIDYINWSDLTDLVRASTPPLFVPLVKKAVCNAHETYCNGTNKATKASNRQWSSPAACLATLDSIDFGMEPAYANRLASNTVACRLFHARMLDLDPDVHCAHVGPSGGGKCVEPEAGGLPYRISVVDQHVPRFAFNSIPAGARQAFNKFINSTE